MKKETVDITYNDLNWLINQSRLSPNIKTDGNHITISNLIISSSRAALTLYYPISPNTVVEFKNCRFKKNNTDKNLTLILNNRHNQFIFNKCIANNLDFDSVKTLEIIEGNYNSIRILNTSNFKLKLKKINSVHIENCNIEEHLNLQNLDFNSFQSINSNFNSGISLKDSNIKEYFKIENDQPNKLHILDVKNINTKEFLLERIYSNSINISHSYFIDYGIHFSEIKSLFIYKTEGGSDFIGNSIEIIKFNNNKGKNLEFNQNTWNKSIIKQNQFQNFDLSDYSGETEIIENKLERFIQSSLNTNIDLKIDLRTNYIDHYWFANSTESGININLLIGQINESKIENISNNLIIDVETANKLEVSNCKAPKIELLATNLEESFFQNIECQTLNVVLKNGGNINLTDLDVKNLLFNNSNINSIALSNANNSFTFDLLSLLNVQSNDIYLTDISTNKTIIETVKSRIIYSKNSVLKELAIKSSNMNILEFSCQSKIILPNNSFWLFENHQKCDIQINNVTASRLLIDNLSLEKENVPNQNFNITNSNFSLALLFNFHRGNFSTENTNCQNLLVKNKSITLQSYSPRISFINGEYGYIKFLNFGNHAILNLHLINFQFLQVILSELNTLDVNGRKDTSLIPNINLIESSISDLNFNDLTVKTLVIKEIKPTNFGLNRLNINELQLLEFSLNNIQPNGIRYREMNFINLSTNKLNKMKVINSDLSGLKFNSCYFNRYNELEIKSSKLDEIKCTATLWPSLVTSYIEETNKLHHFEIREACRQLKYAMNNHHDRVSELQFHSLEMNAYKNIIYDQLSWKNTGDWISLIGGWTNNFGLSWGRPTILLILFSTFFYSMILYNHYSDFTRPFKCFLCYFNSIDYFQIFNPTHRISQLSLQGNITFWTAFNDFFSRIFSAFFIFQIVAAFRKFRK